jgi:hypothetical protein
MEFHDSIVLLGTFQSGERFKILKFSIFILKFKKYRVRRFVHSPVRVFDKFLHGETRLPAQTKKISYFLDISQKML